MSNSVAGSQNSNLQTASITTLSRSSRSKCDGGMHLGFITPADQVLPYVINDPMLANKQAGVEFYSPLFPWSEFN